MSYLASQEQRERIDSLITDERSFADVMRDVVDAGLRAKKVPMPTKEESN